MPCGITLTNKEGSKELANTHSTATDLRYSNAPADNCARRGYGTHGTGTKGHLNERALRNVRYENPESALFSRICASSKVKPGLSKARNSLICRNNASDVAGWANGNQAQSRR